MRIYAHVRENRLEIIENDKLNKFLKNKIGDLITIDLEKVHSIRSIQENKYYFGVVISILSDFFGYTPDEMHEIIKTTFLTEKVRMKRDKRKKLTITRSTTNLTTKEFEDFLERVRTWAQLEFNIVIPLPDKEYRNNPAHV